MAVRYASLFLAVIDLVAAALVWVAARTMVSRAEFHALHERVVRMEQRPSWNALIAVRDDLAALNARVSGLAEKIDATKHTVDLIQEHLLRAEGAP
jgi:hypothetical protein